MWNCVNCEWKQQIYGLQRCNIGRYVYALRIYWAGLRWAGKLSRPERHKPEVRINLWIVQFGRLIAGNFTILPEARANRLALPSSGGEKGKQRTRDRERDGEREREKERDSRDAKRVTDKRTREISLARSPRNETPSRNSRVYNRCNL